MVPVLFIVKLSNAHGGGCSALGEGEAMESEPSAISGQRGPCMPRDPAGEAAAHPCSHPFTHSNI